MAKARQSKATKRAAGKASTGPTPKVRARRGSPEGASTAAAGDAARPGDGVGNRVLPTPVYRSMDDAAPVSPAELSRAFDSFAADIDAYTVPDGDGRRITDPLDAEILSESAARLASMLVAGIVSPISGGLLPRDVQLDAVMFKAAGVVALPTDRANAGQPRFRYGDVLTKEQLKLFYRARRQAARCADKANTGGGEWSKPLTLVVIGAIVNCSPFMRYVRPCVEKLGGKIEPAYPNARQSFIVRYDKMPSGVAKRLADA